MIRFDITRQKALVQSTAVSKTQKAIKQQITQGIKSSPFRETQILDIKINDHPVERFLTKLFDIDEEVVNADLKAELTRAYMNKGQLFAEKYQFRDTFPANQLTELKEGKNLLNKKDSFISRLVEEINKVIGE